MRAAYAKIKGSPKYPDIRGMVSFLPMQNGTVVSAEIYGVTDENNIKSNGFKGFHIHEGESCTGNETDPFADAKGHYNPGNQPHPLHAGDMPPIFGNGGQAQLLFVTDRFTVDDVIGRTVIVHGNPDDFTTQPSGNAGEKIGCGIIAAAYGERAL